MSKTPTNQEVEQAAASARDNLTVLWWALYRGCLDRGFTKTQAMQLLQTFILKLTLPEDEE